MSAQDKLNYYVSQIDKELSKYPHLNKFEQQTGVPKVYAVLGVASIFGTFVFFNIAAGFLSNILGWLLPAYFSLKALETPQSGDIQWLTYWTVFGFFNILESFSAIILSWFPFYYTFKTIIIVWLMLPQTRGAETVYHKALRPLVHNAKAKVNETPAAPTASTTQ